MNQEKGSKAQGVKQSEQTGSLIPKSELDSEQLGSHRQGAQEGTTERSGAIAAGMESDEESGSSDPDSRQGRRAR